MQQPFRRFGAFEVFVVKDGFFEAPSDVLTHTAGEDARLRAIAGWNRAIIGVDVNCFALRGPDGVTLVDAGTGGAWGAAFGHAHAALDAIGIAADAVDRILLTHLHGDHALGLFDEDRAHFSRAEIWVPEQELAFFTDEQARAALPKARQSGFDIAAKLLGLYGDRVRAIGLGEVMPGIEAHHLPGHTHGHGGYLIRDAGGSLMLWGDALHLSDLQAADPEIGLIYDLDGTLAARTRRAVLARAAREGWTVSGGHVAGFGRVHVAGEGFEITPA